MAVPTPSTREPIPSEGDYAAAVPWHSREDRRVTLFPAMFTSVRFYIHIAFFVAGVLCVIYGMKLFLARSRQNKARSLLDGKGTVKARRLTGKRVLLIPTVLYDVEMIAPPRYAGFTACSQQFFSHEHFFPHNAHVRVKFKPTDDDAGVEYVVLPLNGVEKRVFILKFCLAICFGFGFMGFALLQMFVL